MKVHTLRAHISTLHLIEDSPERFLLLDSGCRSDPARIEQFLAEQLPTAKMEDIRCVAITHSHPDHLGGAAELRRNWKLPIAGSAHVHRWYAGFFGRITYLVDVALTYYVAAHLGRPLFSNLFFDPDVLMDHLIGPGQTLPEFPEWTVLSLAGHTPNDLGFWHAESGTLYSADTLIKTKRGWTIPYPLFDPEAYRATLERILDLPIRRILLAHYGAHEVDEATRAEWRKLLLRIPRHPRRHRTLPWILVRRAIKKIMARA